MAVLKAMKSFIIKALLKGEVVVLNDLGRLQVTLQGKCYTQDDMKAEDFSPSGKIKSHKITFRPDKELKREVASNLSLKRISSASQARCWRERLTVGKMKRGDWTRPVSSCCIYWTSPRLSHTILMIT